MQTVKTFYETRVGAVDKDTNVFLAENLGYTIEQITSGCIQGSNTRMYAIVVFNKEGDN